MQNFIGQAIQTKFLSPTNFRGSRIKASCARGSLTIPFNSCRDDEHIFTAQALCNKFIQEDEKQYERGMAHKSFWRNKFVSGQLKNGNYVHVFVVPE